MIQQKMQFDRTLGSPVLGPGKHGQAQRDGCAVQRKQLVIEAELALLAFHASMVSLQHRIEKVPIHLPWPVGIRIGQCRLLRRLLKPKMLQLPHTTGKPSADLPDTLGLCQLTEQHRYEMRPGTVSLCLPFSIMIDYQTMKFMTIYQG